MISDWELKLILSPHFRPTAWKPQPRISAEVEEIVRILCTVHIYIHYSNLYIHIIIIYIYILMVRVDPGWHPMVDC